MDPIQTPQQHTHKQAEENRCIFKSKSGFRPKFEPDHKYKAVSNGIYSSMAICLEISNSCKQVPVAAYPHEH
jgi:hypothetical protein